MKLSKEFGTDTQLEQEGVWVDYSPGVRFKIARTENPRYRRRLKQLSEPLRHQLRVRTLSAEQAEDIVTRVVAETVLLDWEGIEHEETGEPLPYTTDEGYKALTNLRDLRAWVFETAENMALFRKDQQQADEVVLGEE